MADNFKRKNFMKFDDFSLHFVGAMVEGCTKEPRAILQCNQNITIKLNLNHPMQANDTKNKKLDPHGSEMFKLSLRKLAELNKRRSGAGWEYEAMDYVKGEMTWVPKVSYDIAINQYNGSPTGDTLKLVRGADGIIKWGFAHFSGKYPTVIFSMLPPKEITMGIGNNVTMDVAEATEMAVFSHLNIWNMLNTAQMVYELEQSRRPENQWKPDDAQQAPAAPAYQAPQQSAQSAFD